jgi:hypothetical protein
VAVDLLQNFLFCCFVDQFKRKRRYTVLEHNPSTDFSVGCVGKVFGKIQVAQRSLILEMRR